MDKVARIYTDGSCHGNPGAGGYCAIVLCDGITREVKGSDWHTTNNRMELTAVIEGLKLIADPYDAHILSDSKYVVEPIRRGNLRAYVNSPDRKNADLWEKILRLSAFHKLTAEWVRGHSGNRLNQYCDKMANQEATRVEREKDIRLFVFKELLSDILATPDQIARAYSGDSRWLETVKKYHKQYFEHYDMLLAP